MTDRHIICDLHIEQDRLWDAIEDRVTKTLDLHLDSIVTEAIEGGMRDVEQLVKMEISKQLQGIISNARDNI